MAATTDAHLGGPFPRVPGDLPANFPEGGPPGNCWTIYNYRERRCYWHLARPETWPEGVQRDFDPDGLSVAERREREGRG